MAMALRSAGRRLLTGKLLQQGIHRAAAEGQQMPLPTAICGVGSLGNSRQYGTFERCMRVGDLFVRATTAVSIISVSTAVLALSVALPVKMYLAPKKPQETRGQPSRSQRDHRVEEKMQELREVLSKYEAQRRAQG